MNIFISNDDGIDSEGIKQLASALASIADIYIGAPTDQCSASGHGISLREPVHVTEVDFADAKLAYAIDGKPADCVKIGLELVRSEGVVIDKVFSGINMGGNLGTDTIYSGTVAAAMEGLICGFPSVAVSVNSRNPKNYEMAQELAIKAAQLDFTPIDTSMMLNINVPDLSKEEIRGVKITGLGPREYDGEFIEIRREGREREFTYAGVPVFYETINGDTNDVGADQEGYAAIVPMHFDMTNYKLMDKLRHQWFKELGE